MKQHIQSTRDKNRRKNWSTRSMVKGMDENKVLKEGENRAFI
jgi:hypothetical protein